MPSRILFVLSLAGLLLTACVGSSPKTSYYLLEPMGIQQDSAEKSGEKRRVVSLGVIHIPHYADRLQIVSAGRDRHYQIDEYHRWAERLDDNIARVLQQNLATLLPDTLIQAHQSRNSSQESLHLGMDILDFLTDDSGRVKLVAQWTISQARQVLISRQSQQVLPVSGDTPATRVEAMNTALNLLSREIAVDLSRPLTVPSNQSGP